MTDREAHALSTVKRMASRGHLRIGPHAKRRMRERGVLPDDIHRAIETSTMIDEQPNGAWRVVDGVDTDGDDLTVIARIEADVIIVTIF